MTAPLQPGQLVTVHTYRSTMVGRYVGPSPFTDGAGRPMPTIEATDGHRVFVCATQVEPWPPAWLTRQHATDDAHRAAGDVACYCGRWVPPTELVEDTCGAPECRLAAHQDRQGLIP